MITVEYVWLDGTEPVRLIRSKMRIIDREITNLEDIPIWNFDGSSTNQATGEDSDCNLKPVCFVKDPLRYNGYLALCEVFDSEGAPHKTNIRSILRSLIEQHNIKDLYEPWIGFEQEYTIFKDNRPLGWPEHGFPGPQGPYYCGVGSEQIFGRPFVEEHTQALIDAGIMLFGINAEVMAGQWEFQLGYRGIMYEDAYILTICDHLILARWLLHRISEKYDYHVSLDNKPIKGDWNGAGMHTNFSTKQMRNEGGLKEIYAAIGKLEEKHKEHIEVYGHKNYQRLTGKHETASFEKFIYGVANRGSSIRIPRSVSENECGYLEDRRPGANADPYLVAYKLCETICT